MKITAVGPNYHCLSAITKVPRTIWTDFRCHGVADCFGVQRQVTVTAAAQDIDDRFRFGTSLSRDCEAVNSYCHRYYCQGGKEVTGADWVKCNQLSASTSWLAISG